MFLLCCRRRCLIIHTLEIRSCSRWILSGVEADRLDFTVAPSRHAGSGNLSMALRMAWRGSTMHEARPLACCVRYKRFPAPLASLFTDPIMATRSCRPG